MIGELTNFVQPIKIFQLSDLCLFSQAANVRIVRNKEEKYQKPVINILAKLSLAKIKNQCTIRHGENQRTSKRPGGHSYSKGI